VPIRLHKDVEQPFGLGNRHWIDFTGEFEHGLSRLRLFLRDMDSPKGILQSLKDRHADAERDLRRAKPEEQPRIQAEIEELNKQIEIQEEIVRNPKAAEEKTEKNIQSGLERERQPEKPVAGKTSTRFINPPPGVAPNYFQDRLIETEQIRDFLNNDSQRLMTIVGRAGVGKTAMVCRLLKALERGELPDDLGEMKADGIVYLSETGSHRVNFANVFADLSKLLSKEDAERLEGIYKNPQTSTDDKMRALLDAFPSGRVILLLDNFENLINSESLNVLDSELSDALNVVLTAPHHVVKVIITTRIAPRDLGMVEPSRQHPLDLDDGLKSPYAEEVLRSLDADGRVGLKTAPDALLNKAREKTRGYPRALEALYAILSVDRYTTLEELLELSLPDEVVQKLVGEAFNRLDPSAQKVMQALAVYNRPVSPAAIDYLLQPHLPSIDSALVLNRLVNMHFARREAGRYYLHPADREYAFGIIPEGEKGKTKEERDELRFTQYELLDRAADYFAQARKPRAEWKKLDDLSAQLAEFDLRCTAENYDTAASMLSEIDFDYLLLWGHYRLMIQLHEKTTGKIKDPFLHMKNLNGLGSAYKILGDAHKSIYFLEQGIPVAQAAKNHHAEGVFLSNLGNAYVSLGNTRKAVEFYEQALSIARKISNKGDEGVFLGNLGNAYVTLGEARKAIEFYEQALSIARKISDKRNEGNWINNLGEVYAALGEARKAIDFYEQALVITRKIGNKFVESSTLGNIGGQYEILGQNDNAITYYQQSLEIKQLIGDRQGEAIFLGGIGHIFLNLDEYQKAKENYQKSIQISDEILFPPEQQSERGGLAETYLFQNDLVNARATIEAALQYDVPANNHNATALHGIIALRQGERVTAQEAFTKSIAQADEILAKTPDYYSALDAKGLALCGLILAGRGDIMPVGYPTMPTETNAGKTVPPDKSTVSNGRVAPTVNDAIETFRQARKIAPHAGVVKSVLRLFDELVKCDEEGVLKGAREVIVAKPLVE
jgi:tetratricopeptide (TPR) repeat protein